MVHWFNSLDQNSVLSLVDLYLYHDHVHGSLANQIDSDIEMGRFARCLDFARGTDQAEDPRG